MSKEKLVSGKVALVAGGAGEVGEGVVRALLEAGATVVVPARTQDKLETLRSRLDAGLLSRLVTEVVSIGTLEGAQALSQRIEREHGRLDLAVASLGGWWQGPRLAEMPMEQWHQVLQNNLTSHFVAARAFLPLVEKSKGAYVMLNGGAVHGPISGSGAISIVAAAQSMMKQVLAAESHGARVHSVIIETPVRSRSRPHLNPAWLSADEIGRYVVTLATDVSRQAETVSLERRELERVLGRHP